MNVAVEPSASLPAPESPPGRPPARWTQPLETLAIMCGFALLLASQWVSWFHVHLAHGINPGAVPIDLSHGAITAADAPGSLTVVYFLGWFAVLGLCSATVFGPYGVRRVCGPVGIGVVGGQALLLLQIVHTRGMSSEVALNLPLGGHHQPCGRAVPRDARSRSSWSGDVAVVGVTIRHADGRRHQDVGRASVRPWRIWHRTGCSGERRPSRPGRTRRRARIHSGRSSVAGACRGIRVHRGRVRAGRARNRRKAGSRPLSPPG